VGCVIVEITLKYNSLALSNYYLFDIVSLLLSLNRVVYKWPCAGHTSMNFKSSNILHNGIWYFVFVFCVMCLYLVETGGKVDCFQFFSENKVGFEEY
jgi:hypothetical protein